MSLKAIVKRCLQVLKKPKNFLFHNHIGKNVEICKGAYITHSNIGDYNYLGMYSYFNHVKMGNYCSISGFVTIGAMEHDYKDVSSSTHLGDGGYSNRTTHIGNDVWIGAQCVVRQGITIGDGAVIGANSFVNKDIPPYAIAFGTPIKVYKYRFDENTINAIRNSSFWTFAPSKARMIIKEIKSANKNTFNNE